MVDTGTVRDRRSLRLETIDDLLGEVDRICAAEELGTLRWTGNWTPGQVLGHLAGWIEYGYEGYPFKTPWLIRLILRSRVRKILRDGMTAGFKIPKVEGGTYATEPISTTEGAERLRAALQRLKSGEPARFDSPGFGPMSHDDRIAFNLRHAELHLGFLHP